MDSIGRDLVHRRYNLAGKAFGFADVERVSLNSADTVVQLSEYREPYVVMQGWQGAFELAYARKWSDRFSISVPEEFERWLARGR
jgi:hypothetical protein